MTRSSFLARKTLGQPRYLLVAMACAFVLALIPGGARRTLQSPTNNPERWLADDFHEVQDLAWFRDHFRGDQFAVVSWDGCTLGNAERLELLAKKLVPSEKTAARDGAALPDAARAQWYARVTTGPQLIRQLMQSHVGLTYAAAINRLEGALVGPPQRDARGRALGNESRTTCLIVDLAPAALADDAAMRAAIDAIPRIAASECGINAATIHMGGGPVDNSRIDAEGRRTLVWLAALAGVVSAGLCFWRLGSLRLTAIVIAVGAASAGLSLAIVFYFGVFEVLMTGRTSATWGGLDALLMAMPAIVYFLAVSAALHLVNYYREARRQPELAGDSAAADESVRMAWRPTVIAALATAAALATLAISDVIPLQKFGLLTAVSLFGMVALLFGITSVVLHRFPLGISARDRRTATNAASSSRLADLYQLAVENWASTLAASLLIFGLLSAGTMKLSARVQVLKLLDGSSTLAQDYAWFESHLGNVVPMEVVLTMPAERLRTGDEHAEQDGQQYRLTMLERLELMRQIAKRLEAFPQISRALSAATFAPGATETGLDGADRGGDYAKNKALEYHRDRMLASDYLRIEHAASSERLTGRELWRLNARVAAMSVDGAPADFGVLLDQVQQAVEPVLWSYQQRDMLVRALHQQGKQLAGSRVCVLFRAPNRAMAPPKDVQEFALAELLRTSGVAARGVTYFNLALYEKPGRGNVARDDEFRRSALASLRTQDAVVLASAPRDPMARKIAKCGVFIVDVTNLPAAAEFIGQQLTDDGGPRPIRAVYTGVAPVVNRAQRVLMGNLTNALWLTAGIVAVVITLSLMSLPAGALALIPSLAPLAAACGAMGWLGLKMDLGVAMAAGLALGVAVEGAMHFINWFQSGLAEGLDRGEAVEQAYHRCGISMIETALITGVGLAVLTLSAFTPLRELAYFMIVTLGASLAANLVLLPAMLASPLGWFFAPTTIRKADPLGPKVLSLVASRRNRAVREEVEVIPLAQPPKGPHYGDAPVPAPARRTVLTVSADERREIAEGPHAALHAKLQGLRRPRTGDSTAS